MFQTGTCHFAKGTRPSKLERLRINVYHSNARDSHTEGKTSASQDGISNAAMLFTPDVTAKLFETIRVRRNFEHMISATKRRVRSRVGTHTPSTETGTVVRRMKRSQRYQNRRPGRQISDTFYLPSPLTTARS